MRPGWWLLAGLAMTPVSTHAANPSALWSIVNGKCVPHEQAAHDPAPCALVDLTSGVQKGYAVLKDINGIAQFLLIPTARLDGIEDPAILATGETNFWEAGWQSRYFVEERLHRALPRYALSLAINSKYGRTQNQLHLHIDCISLDVRDALAASLDKVTDDWTLFPTTLAGHTYRAIRIRQETLAGIDPFHLLADRDPSAAGDMGRHTLVLIGATFADGANGFVLLDDHADLLTGDRAVGEQLQDHTCGITTALPAATTAAPLR